MPERFYEGGIAPGGGGRLRRILIIGIIVVVVLGLIVLGYALFQQMFSGENENTNLVVNTGNGNENVNLNANANANANANVNTNANTNATGNLNTNTGNANANANGNTNTNGNVNENVNENENTNTGASLTKLPSTTDTDDDGLTDVEEELYGTSADQPDTDGDGFIDGKDVLASGEIVGEIYLGYNPNGTGRLDASGLVRTYTSSQQQYSTLYPTPWLAQPTNATETTLLFTPSDPTGEYMQIAIQDNAAQVTAEQWYLSVNPSVSASQLTDISVNGLVGILSPDESSAYLAKGTKMYIISYITGNLEELNYWTTFEVLYSNFRLSSGSTNTNS